jgi:hypothetical protein
MMRRAHAPKPSVYLSAWFNSLRTAYGMALYARRTENKELMSLAQQTLNMALKARRVMTVFSSVLPCRKIKATVINLLTYSGAPAMGPSLA